jgi:sec-independent protein translocase protein TatA
MPVLAVGPFGLGPFELVLILAIVIIIFGVGRLPEVGGAIGKGIREFRRASKEEEEPKQISEGEAEGAQLSSQAQAPSGEVSCAKCGAVNSPGARFCSNCGAAL